MNKNPLAEQGAEGKKNRITTEHYPHNPFVSPCSPGGTQRPAVPLRPHQEQALEAVFDKLHTGVTRQLIALPTGTGKTILAMHVAARFNRTLFLVHREELLRQTLEVCSRVFPDRALEAGVIWQDRHEVKKRFTVAMITTIYKRLDRIPRNAFDLVICDECHHGASKSWRAVVEHFNCDLRLGLSATPERHDGAPLSDLFDEIVYSLSIREAVEEQILVCPQVLSVKTQAVLDGVRVTAGDLNEGDLAEVIDTPSRNRLIATKYTEHAANRKALVFTAGIDHAGHIAAMMQSYGVAADYVYGTDPNREAKLAAFARGDIQVMANAQVLTEGFDQPDVAAILMARPTKSRPFFAQLIGRGLRLALNKSDCLILDFVDNTRRHSLVTAWNFFGHEIPCPSGMVNPLAEDDQEIVRQERLKRAREKAEELGLDCSITWLERWIDIWKPPPPETNNNQYQEWAWHCDPATEKQVALLVVHGYDAREWTKGQCSAVISKLPASNKQLRLLMALGYDVLSSEWTRGQASRVLEQAKLLGKTPNWSMVPRGFSAVAH